MKKASCTPKDEKERVDEIPCESIENPFAILRVPDRYHFGNTVPLSSWTLFLETGEAVSRQLVPVI